MLSKSALNVQYDTVYCTILGIGRLRRLAKRSARRVGRRRRRVRAVSRVDGARALDVVDVRAEEVGVALVQLLVLAFGSRLLVLDALSCERTSTERM